MKKTFKIKFKFKDKGISTHIEAESAAMAKQKVLAAIYFVSVEEIEPLQEGKNIMDFINGFGK